MLFLSAVIIGIYAHYYCAIHRKELYEYFNCTINMLYVLGCVIVIFSPILFASALIKFYQYFKVLTI
jgi:hypothetical protein